MKLRKILAAAMAMTVICGAQTALTLYQLTDGITAVATEIVDSGICGENLTWELDTEGTLTIRGKGEMPDVEAGSETPWAKSGRKDDIKNVIVENGITRIGGVAFADCSGLTSVIIPESVTKIGYGAFWGSSIETVSIPNGVTEIEGSVFAECPKLTSITIPDSVTSIGNHAFYSTGLTSITIPNSVVNIDDSAFGLCNSLTSISIQNGVERIGECAFADCTGFKEIIIPESVVSIEKGAFGGCTGLNSITIKNPNCVIADSDDVIGNELSTYEENGSIFLKSSYTGIIFGYKESTSRAYAEKFNYKFEAINDEAAKEVSFGDPTGDGKIDAKDSSLVLVEYAKLSTGGESTLSKAEQDAADVNGDGKADAKDASAILSYYAYVSTGGTDTIQKFLKTE